MCIARVIAQDDASCSFKRLLCVIGSLDSSSGLHAIAEGCPQLRVLRSRDPISEAGIAHIAAHGAQLRVLDVPRPADPPVPFDETLLQFPSLEQLVDQRPAQVAAASHLLANLLLGLALT